MTDEEFVSIKGHIDNFKKKKYQIVSIESWIKLQSGDMTRVLTFQSQDVFISEEIAKKIASAILPIMEAELHRLKAEADAMPLLPSESETKTPQFVL